MSRKGVIEIEVECKLDQADFKPWEDLSPAQQEQQKGTGMGCEGHGDFGGLCLRCIFCADWETTDYYEVNDMEEQAASKQVKNRAVNVCYNCGTEMVRARFEIEDGWVGAWLCKCDDAEPDQASNQAGIMSNAAQNPGEQIPAMVLSDEELQQQVPEKLQSWRHLDPEHHHACFRCGGTDKLTTIALERDGVIYGFVFTCGGCLLATERGTQIVWRVRESDGTSGP